MTTPVSPARFRAELLRPADANGAAAWTFVVLPKAASAKLASRGLAPLTGAINGVAFAALADPDGRKSHWLKVPRKLSDAAGAKAGDTVDFEISPAAKDYEPTVPPDLKKGLAAHAKARAAWEDITPAARLDWIHWLTSAKLAETRVKRIHAACDMLAKGKRRVCCFDRSGFYSKAFSAPTPAK